MTTNLEQKTGPDGGLKKEVIKDLNKVPANDFSLDGTAEAVYGVGAGMGEDPGVRMYETIERRKGPDRTLMDRIDPNKIKEKEWMDMDNKFEQGKELDSYTVSKIKEWFKTIGADISGTRPDPDEPNIPDVPDVPGEPDVSGFATPGEHGDTEYGISDGI